MLQFCEVLLPCCQSHGVEYVGHDRKGGCAAAQAVSLLKDVPNIVAWSLLPDVAQQGASPEIQFPTVTVCAAQRNVEGAPSADIRLFGPHGIRFNEGSVTRPTALVRFGHDDVGLTRRAAPATALHVSVRSNTLVACGHRQGVITVADDSTRVDIRWLQLLRDSGEMLLCHSFVMTGCMCPRHGLRRPEIHNSSAQMLCERGVLHAPTLSALLMLYVLAGARVLAPKQVQRGKSKKLWHTSVAEAVSLAVGLRGNCMDRWGGQSDTCSESYMSILAALPSAILGQMREPFEPETWDKAMEAARTRQGSSRRLDNVRSHCCYLVSGFLIYVFPASCTVYVGAFACHHALRQL